ncbi:lysoplasmalogenase [Nocardioides sp. J2M5]|uniref:lysoplasmalogenase n=1 Tax=Nocardioides palaemonis TaxID=2829810 RepID=UPI001BA9EC7D|nr:lysoplasmalogenase [Nocardioides palaemonis]MBS2937333.1 lysoplasmalogenase [Nocardioides palaemonis]
MPSARALVRPAAYVALAVADTIAAGRGPTARRLRYVLKPALMPALAWASAEHADGSQLARRTTAAQWLSWGGDVALLGDGERAFLAGVGSFFGAHVAYVAGFLSVRDPEPGWSDLRLPLALWAAAAPVMGLAAGRQDPSLRAPVTAYATVLSAMFAASRLVDRSLPRSSQRALRAGTALFVVSDTVLATQAFVLARPRPAIDAFVMATYTAGQGLIAAGVAGSSQRAT